MSTGKIGRNARAQLGLIKGHSIENPEPFKAFGVQKTKDGYRFVEITFDNKEITKVSADPAEGKAHALQKLMIATNKLVMEIQHA